MGRFLIEPEQSIINQNSSLLPSGCLLSCVGGVKSSFRFKLRLTSNPTFDPKLVLWTFKSLILMLNHGNLTQNTLPFREKYCYFGFVGQFVYLSSDQNDSFSLCESKSPNQSFEEISDKLQGTRDRFQVSMKSCCLFLR